MNKRAVVAGGFLALAGGWAITAFGQGIYDQPAEYPPASYEGRQYVDSRGCVYIRAGIDGQVSWVPRVSREREVICDQVPTFTPAQLAALNGGGAASVPVLPGPQISNVTPVAPVAVAAPAPAPHPNVVNDIYMPGFGGDMAGSMQGDVYVPSASMTSGSGMVVNDIYVGPSAQGGGTVAAASGAASGGGMVVNDVYVGPSATTSVAGGTGMVVNDIYVGPSGAAPVGTVSVAGAGNVVNDVYVPSGGASSGAVRVSIPNSHGSLVPAGYRPVWEDDRLNPQRGPRSSTGDASMYAVWSQDTPMRELTGNERRGFAGLTRRVPFMSGKSAPELEPVVTAGGYVQIGAFGQQANVAKNVSRLGRMGLPALVQPQGGVQAVWAGPFASAAELTQALRFLRANGYGDAFAVN